MRYRQSFVLSTILFTLLRKTVKFREIGAFATPVDPSAFMRSPGEFHVRHLRTPTHAATGLCAASLGMRLHLCHRRLGIQFGERRRGTFQPDGPTREPVSPRNSTALTMGPNRFSAAPPGNMIDATFAAWRFRRHVAACCVRVGADRNLAFIAHRSSRRNGPVSPWRTARNPPPRGPGR